MITPIYGRRGKGHWGKKGREEGERAACGGVMVIPNIYSLVILPIN